MASAERSSQVWEIAGTMEEVNRFTNQAEHMATFHKMSHEFPPVVFQPTPPPLPNYLFPKALIV